MYDRARAAIGTVIHQVDEPPLKPPNVVPPPATSTTHVVQRAGDGALAGSPTTWRARWQAFGTRTAMRTTATSGWVPVWLAVSTVTAMYLLPALGMPASTSAASLVIVLFGLAVGLLLWLGAAATTNADARPDQANPRSYSDLVGRMNEAEATIECRVAAARLAPDAAPVVDLGVLKARLIASPPDADWASGMAYVSAWRDLHRIEESLVSVADRTELDGMLRHDQLRVEGSKLDRKDSLVRSLIEDARKRLDADADDDVRSLLLPIRQAVNDFRDRRFEALVRNRMYVDRVSLLLGLAAWALLCLTVLAGASPTQVTGVAALYLIGAAMGLFTQLRSGPSESLEDVFGYGQAQLRQTLLLSGLAGVAGVFLTAVIGAAAADPATSVTLTGALEFTALTAVTAAAFGLAPGTLVDRLNGWATTNIKDLESTTSAGGGERN
jgi:hypothetical protein